MTLGMILVIGGLGWRSLYSLAAHSVYGWPITRTGLAMSAHLSGGSLGFSFAPVMFAPFIASDRAPARRRSSCFPG